MLGTPFMLIPISKFAVPPALTYRELITWKPKPLPSSLHLQAMQKMSVSVLSARLAIPANENILLSCKQARRLCDCEKPSRSQHLHSHWKGAKFYQR